MNGGQVEGSGQPPVGPEGMVEPKKRGCLFWGCIISLILIVCIGGCTGFFLYRGVKMMKEYVSPQPRALPEYQPRPGEYEEIRQGIQKFKQRGPDQPAELVLSADDLNAILASDPQWRRLKSHAHFRIEEDKLFLDLSLPIAELRTLLGDGYLNATVRLRPVLNNGKPSFDIAEATANEKPVGETLIAILLVTVIKDLKEADLLESMPQASSIEVKGGKLILKK